jgi:hypothetical protein
VQVLVVSRKICKAGDCLIEPDLNGALVATVSFLLNSSAEPTAHATQNSHYKFKFSKGLALKHEYQWTQN